MKKLTIAFCCCLIVGGHVLAAENEARSTGVERRPLLAQLVDRQLDRMKEMLTLSISQAEKIKPILVRNQAKFRELRQNTGLSQEDRRAKMREIVQESAAEMKAILTAEQQAKWREEMLKRRDEWSKRQADQ